ncbi:Kunitz/Bovine pancreatic trypsin inhibitor domain protein [Cooperia oncophora]
MFSGGVISKEQCRIGDDCGSCVITQEGDKCTEEITQESLYCDVKTNKTDLHENAFLICNLLKNRIERKICGTGQYFIDGKCRNGHVRYKRQGIAGSGRVGDFCSFNTDCLTQAMANVKTAMEGVYDLHPAADGICCPNRAFTCIQPKREADTGSAAPAGVRPRWWYNAVTGTCEQFMWDPWDETEMQSPNNFKTREHCESYCRDSEFECFI